jgi:hypothetical protein
VVLSGHYSNPAETSADVDEADTATTTRRPRQVQRRLTEAETERLVDQYEAGATIGDLSGEFGIHRTTASSLLNRRGVKIRVNSRRLTDDDVQQAAALYAEGCSLAEVGRRFGVRDTTIFREFRKAGVSTRPRNGASG